MAQTQRLADVFHWTECLKWGGVIAATLIVLSGSLFNAAVGAMLTQGRMASDAVSETPSK